MNTQCDDCGYNGDQQEFTLHCVICGNPEDACNCEIVDLVDICENCTAIRTLGF